MYEVTIFGIHLTLNPVAFTIPIGKGWDIYWYGIIIATGFLLALIYGMKNAARYNINVDRMLDVALVTTPVAILCARTYFLLFDGDKTTGLSDFFGFDDSSGFSGLAIYGGVIGAALCGFLMCLLRKVKFTDMLDISATGFLIGQGIGRWGNFVNQEAYGSFTGSSWWGMQSDRTIAEMGEGLVHPCFLYESIWCIAGFFILHALSKKRKFSGEVALMYGIWYGFGRMIIESLRTDSLPYDSDIRISRIVSILLFVGCSAALIVIRKRIKETALNEEYSAVFSQQTDDEQTSKEISEEAVEESGSDAEPKSTVADASATDENADTEKNETEDEENV